MKMKKFLAAALGFVIALAASAAEPKYIFYYIGDGMGMGPVVAAEMYNRQVRQSATPLTMFQFPVAGMCLTYSASSPVTDSAAAGTALSTGHKTSNGMLGMTPDTVAVTSMARVLKDDGYGIGIVTTVAADDATPGAFFANVPKRGMYRDIILQGARSGYEFIAGAGLRAELDKKGKPTGLIEEIEREGVKVVRGRDGISEIADAQRVMLIGEPGSNPSNVSFTIDSVEGALTLPIITEACMAHLERVSPDRFFMMVEGGNIDHSLHANDAATTIKEIINFDQALALAFDFYRRHPEETLIVVTADHDTGGFATGNNYKGYFANFANIDCQRVSKEEFENYCRGILRSRRTYTWDDMKEYLSENLGFYTAIPISEKQDAALREKFNATFELRNSPDQKTLYKTFNGFAAEVFKIMADVSGFGFTSTHHTGNPVPVFAVGVGAERFVNLNNNIEIPVKILDIAGKKLPDTNK